MENKVAIVTAAGRGMGAAIAEELAAQGYQLALMSPSGGSVTLAEKLGGDKRHDHAAMVLSTLFGMALMRKNFRLHALKDLDTEEIRARNNHLVQSALKF